MELKAVKSQMDVSHRKRKGENVLLFRNLQLNCFQEKEIKKGRDLRFENCTLNELALKSVELKTIEIINCDIQTLCLDSLKSLSVLRIVNCKINQLALIKNDGFDNIELCGVQIKEGKLLQNHGAANSSISLDIETTRMNKLNVMYNYASSFDLTISGKMRSLHLRRNNFDHIEFNNSSSPHTKIEVRSA